MHFLSLLPSVLLASTATASANSAFGLSAFGHDQVRLSDDAFPIPGDNPLEYCADPADYLLNVTKIDISPNPPKAGDKLVIDGIGEVLKDIKEGAKIQLQVKYGLIRLINQQMDLCEYADKIDEKCPIKKGPLKIKKDVDLPKQIPPGKYTVIADVTQGEGDEEEGLHTCLKEMEYGWCEAGVSTRLLLC